MAFDEEFIKGMSAIYKYVFENKEVHRNVLRKQMLNKGKIASKEKFNKIVEGLSALGKIKIDREQVTLNPNVVSLGVLQKGGNDFYVVTPNSNIKVGFFSARYLFPPKTICLSAANAFIFIILGEIS